MRSKSVFLVMAMMCILMLDCNLAVEGADFRQPGAIDNLIISGAKCLDDRANWIDRKQGRQIYNALKKVKSDLVIDSLVRQVLKSTNRLQVLFLGVKLGIPGSQERLNNVLMKYGNKRMAEDFLNSGSRELYEGGKRWANAHGYYIGTGMGSHRVGWGRF